MAAGSINKVEPLALWSWMMPCTWFLYSDLIGIQYRFPRMVMMLS